MRSVIVKAVVSKGPIPPSCSRRCLMVVRVAARVIWRKASFVALWASTARRSRTCRDGDLAPHRRALGARSDRHQCPLGSRRLGPRRWRIKAAGRSQHGAMLGSNVCLLRQPRRAVPSPVGLFSIDVHEPATASGPEGWPRYCPTVPSINSRTESACPAWRAVSLIRCKRTQRRVVSGHKAHGVMRSRRRTRASVASARAA